MKITEYVRIAWYEGLENYLTEAQSADVVLAGFFTVREWGFIKAFNSAIMEENDLHLDERGLVFNGDAVGIYTPEGESCLAREDLYLLAARLYEILIEGANEDHHSVRYEPWWQAFIDAAYLLDTKCNIFTLTEEEKIRTDRLSNR